MGVFQGLVKLVTGSALDNVSTVLDVFVEDGEQHGNSWRSFHQRKEDRTERGSKLRVLQQKIKRLLRLNIAPDAYFHAHATLVGIVVHADNAVKFPAAWRDWRCFRPVSSY